MCMFFGTLMLHVCPEIPFALQVVLCSSAQNLPLKATGGLFAGRNLLPSFKMRTFDEQQAISK